MKQGVIEEYEDNQLVVAIADLAVVRGALGSFPVGREERHERLGLALLTLRDVEAAAKKLNEDDSGLAARVTEAKQLAGPAEGDRAHRTRSSHLLATRTLPVRLRRLGSDHREEPRDRPRARTALRRWRW